MMSGPDLCVSKTMVGPSNIFTPKGVIPTSKHTFNAQGPALRGWFLNLDKGFGPTKTMKDAVKKVFIDQFVFAPVLVAILVPLFGFSQGMDRVQVREKVVF